MVGIDLIALVVSFVALFTTVVQVLQQFVATAEGYRRCNASVMGPWAKKTHKRWRWLEFRYETLYTAPEFLVQSSDLAQQKIKLITGDRRSREDTITPSKNMGHEQVCWIPFLKALHDRSEHNLKGLEGAFKENFITVPVLRLQERSWDFMPPDVVRPLASSNLSDICILLHRLGMHIKENGIRPYEGDLRAEGSGHVVTSTMVRGMGLILHYIYLGDQPNLEWKDTLIWNMETDKMGFGILPGIKDFSLPDFVIGTEEDALDRLREIDPELKARDHVRSNLSVNKHWVIGFIDIIPLAAPMLRIRGSSTIRIPAPYLHDREGLTYFSAGFKAFHYQLRAMVEKDKHEAHDREQRIWVLQQYEKLKEKHSELWEDEVKAEEPGRRTMEFLDDVHNDYDKTTEYFKRLERDYHTIPFRFKYRDLVNAHITHAVFYWPECSQKIGRGQGRPHFNARVVWHSEGMHVYFDFLPRYVEAMKAAGCDDANLVTDAWVTLMYRAFCWHRCHLLVEGQRIPSQYYGSRQPVYIG